MKAMIFLLQTCALMPIFGTESWMFTGFLTLHGGAPAWFMTCYRPMHVIRRETECETRQTQSYPGPSLSWPYIHELDLTSWSLSSLYCQMGTNISLARWPHPWEQDHSKARGGLDEIQKEMEAGRPLTDQTDVYEAEGVLGLWGEGD